MSTKELTTEGSTAKKALKPESTNGVPDVLFIIVPILLAVICFICATIWKDVSDHQQKALKAKAVFDEHFAHLPEVQQLYNLSALSTSAEIFKVKEVNNVFVEGFGEPLPHSYAHLLSDLLLQSLSKQRVLEAKLEGQSVVLDSLTVALVVAFLYIIYVHLFSRKK